MRPAIHFLHVLALGIHQEQPHIALFLSPSNKMNHSFCDISPTNQFAELKQVPLEQNTSRGFQISFPPTGFPWIKNYSRIAKKNSSDSLLPFPAPSITLRLNEARLPLGTTTMLLKCQKQHCKPPILHSVPWVSISDTVTERD